MKDYQRLICIRSEIHNVLSTMRTFGRWGNDDRFVRELPNGFEDPMIGDLKNLHEYLQVFEDVEKVDAVEFIRPFLNVIRFPNANGIVTGRALASVNKFLMFNVLTPDSRRAREAINLAVLSLLECKFEATNSHKDEIVLTQLLEAIVTSLQCPVGDLISDINVWKMIENCYRLFSDQRSSQLLRSMAFNSLTQLILKLFSRTAELVTPDQIAKFYTRNVNFDEPSRSHVYQAPIPKIIRARLPDDADEEDENEAVYKGTLHSIAGNEDSETTSSSSAPLSVSNVEDDENFRALLKQQRFLEGTAASRFLDSERRLEQTDERLLGGVWAPLSDEPFDDEDPDESLLKMLQPIRYGNSSVASQSWRTDMEEFKHVDPYGLPVLKKVLEFLSRLADPSRGNENERVFALQLINLVLESGGEALCWGGQDSKKTEATPIVHVLQGDLCKNLLLNSQSRNLNVLSVSLRVIFNLFNAMRGHLKVQLEVFLTSVHLHIVGSPSTSFEQKELALESLLEFCREPALLLDLYTNYDCDIHCTNLFETLFKCLCRCAIPKWILSDNNFLSSTSTTLYSDDDHILLQPSFSYESYKSYSEKASPPSSRSSSSKSGIAVLEGLALEGVLSFLEAIAWRCDIGKTNDLSKQIPDSADDLSVSLTGKSDSTLADRNVANSGEYLNVDSVEPASSADERLDSAGSHATDNFPEVKQDRDALRTRKRRKHRLLLAAQHFNTEPNKDRWLNFAQKVSILPNPLTAESVASFFLKTPGVDKAAVGNYLSEDASSKPLNAQVLKEYLGCFDFKGMRIDIALRGLLESFRLPGEAQKVDRIMQAFGERYYYLNSKEKESGNHDEEILQHGPAESSDVEVTPAKRHFGSTYGEERGEDFGWAFKSADAVFIFAFSIIMLHTDLHSPEISPEKKMTKSQFVKNNHLINEGEDLPTELVTSVYEAIRDDQMRLMYDPHDGSSLHINRTDSSKISGIHDTVANGSLRWDRVLRHSSLVNEAIFTPRELGRAKDLTLHERDMFLIVFDPFMHAVSVMLEMASDGRMVARVLEGFCNIGKIAIFYNLDEHFDRVVVTLCKHFARFFPKLFEIGEGVFDRRSLTALRDAFLLSSKCRENDFKPPTYKLKLQLAAAMAKAERYGAYPTCRALLTFKTLLSFIRQFGGRFHESWRNCIQVFLYLSSAELMPSDLSVRMYASGTESTTDTDSNYSKPSQPREISRKKNTGFLSSITSFIFAENEEQDELRIECRKLICECIAASRVDKLFIHCHSWSKESLLLLLDSLLMPLEGLDLTGQANGNSSDEITDVSAGLTVFDLTSIFCIEMITRVGIGCREKIVEIWWIIRRAYWQALVNTNLIQESKEFDFETSYPTIDGKQAGQPMNDDPSEKVLGRRGAPIRRVKFSSSIVAERIVECLLGLCEQRIVVAPVSSSIIATLGWIIELPDDFCAHVSKLVGQGLKRILEKNSLSIRRVQDWRTFCRLLCKFSQFSESVDLVWSALFDIITQGKVYPVNLKHVIEALSVFTRNNRQAAPPKTPPTADSVGKDRNEWPAIRAGEAIRLLYVLTNDIVGNKRNLSSPVVFSSPESGKKLPLFNGVTGQGGVNIENLSSEEKSCRLPSRKQCWFMTVLAIRANFDDESYLVAPIASQCLQKALFTLSAPSQFRSELPAPSELFDQVVFPLVECFTDKGSVEIKIDAANVMTRTLLHFGGDFMNTPDEFRRVWIHTVDLLSRNLPKENGLEESAMENLKNLLMVFDSEGLSLRNKTEESSSATLLEFTWNIIESHRPGTRNLLEPLLQGLSKRKP